jgi:hypothetical protein
MRSLRNRTAVRRHERPPSLPMRYVTDGRRLFRVVSLFDPNSDAVAELEDCMTLEIGRYSPDDLYRMGLRPVSVG